MKKIIIGFMCLFLVINVYSAQLIFSLPDEISVREHWISLTKSYDIETKTRKLGTLYRRFFSLLLTYDFYDANEINTLTAEARLFSFGAHLDLYDPKGFAVGSVEEKIFTFFPTFVIYAPDLSTKLARAEMNFWGTKFYVYDYMTNRTIAIMSRSFFHLKNDWTIKVTNKALIDQRNIDPRVLMTVLAVQGEIEDWQKDNDQEDCNDNDDYNCNQYFMMNKVSKIQSPNQLPQRLSILAKSKLDNVEPNQEQLEALANELDQDFNAINPSISEQSNEDRIQAFSAYCESLINNGELSAEKKNAILTLLKLRLSRVLE